MKHQIKHRYTDAAALRAQIHLQNLPGGPF